MAESSFPAAQCHNDEHDAVLASIREVEQLLLAGSPVCVARKLAEALSMWSPRHADLYSWTLRMSDKLSDIRRKQEPPREASGRGRRAT